jgi:hypothetical protein
MGLKSSKIKINIEELIENDNSKIINDYIIIINDIKVLSDEIINNIQNNMNSEDKMKIILTYNNLIKYIIVNKIL